MPRITPVQRSFSTGEVSPQVYRRQQMQTRQNQRPIAQGTKEMRNFFPDPRGPARSRFGFRYLGNVTAAPPVTTLVFIGQIGNTGGSNWTVADNSFDFNDTLTPTDAYEVRGIENNRQGLFAAAANSQANGTGIYTTTDGVTWTLAGNPWPITDKFVRSLVWDEIEQRWVAFMSNPINDPGDQGMYIRASSDLVNWTTLHETASQSPFYLADTDGAGTWLSGTDNLGQVDQLEFAYSTDNGLTWNIASPTPLQSIGGTESSGQASWAHDRWFFSSGNRGALHILLPGEDFLDPTKWTLRFFTANPFDACSKVYEGFDGAGGKVYLMLRTVDSNSFLLRSTNGVTFDEVPLPPGMAGWPAAQNLRSNIAYDAELGWIIVNGANIFQSVDALTWTASVDDGKFVNLGNVGIGLNP